MFFKNSDIPRPLSFALFLVDQNCIFSFAGYRLSLLESLKQYHAILISVFK